MNGWTDTPLGHWGAAQPEKLAEIVDLASFRERSARWHLVIRPRAESVEVAVLALDRCLGLAPTPALARLPKAAQRRA